MYLGAVVEEGTKADIFERAAHPYTKALLSAEPKPELLSGPRDSLLLRGEPASAAYTPAGCRFHTRCPCATQGCAKVSYPLLPLLRADGGTHKSACPRYKKL